MIMIAIVMNEITSYTKFISTEIVSLQKDHLCRSSRLQICKKMFKEEVLSEYEDYNTAKHYQITSEEICSDWQTLLNGSTLTFIENDGGADLPAVTPQNSLNNILQ